MATIKDVAKLAGVSVSTVSLVLNTTMEQRRVSPQTWQKVHNAMDTLNYRPNKDARKLRKNAKQVPTIGLFWPYHFNSDILGKVLVVLKETFDSMYFECDVIVHMFQAGRLCESAEMISPEHMEGAILGLLGTEDMEWLEQTETELPIVVLSRQMKRYSSVRADNRAMGRLAAEMLIKQKCEKTALLCMKDRGRASQRRLEDFIKTYDAADKEYLLYECLDEEPTEAVVERIKTMVAEEHPDSLVCFTYDAVTYPALFTLLKCHVKIPEQMKIVVVNMSLGSFFHYFSPTVTTVSTPTEQMVADCVKILIHQMKERDAFPVHKIYGPDVFYGETCPQF